MTPWKPSMIPCGLQDYTVADHNSFPGLPPHSSLTCSLHPNNANQGLARNTKLMYSICLQVGNIFPSCDYLPFFLYSQLVLGAPVPQKPSFCSLCILPLKMLLKIRNYVLLIFILMASRMFFQYDTSCKNGTKLKWHWWKTFTHQQLIYMYILMGVNP